MFGIVDINLNLQVGHSYTLHIPTSLDNDGGFFPKEGKVKLENGEFEELIMGFCVEDKRIGTIKPNHSDKVAVDYEHKLPAQNTIWFYASTGERFRMRTNTVTVHDHSNINSGGPAYGTYFSYVGDDSTKES